MTEDLRSFVRDALARGLPRTAIRERLIEAGWRTEEIEHALGAFADVDFPVPVPRRRPSLSAREAFLYLVLFATLYITAFNTGMMLFAVIDRRLRDVAQAVYASEWTVSAIRNGIAGLVIAFPIFLFLTRLIGRSLVRDPEKRGSPIRRWLTYITLFLAALVLIGDLIFVVERLLSGELAMRILLKTLVVFGIAGTIFGHYLVELRREEREQAVAGPGSPWLARIGAIAVVITIALGIFSSDSPRQARQRALDAKRVGDLMGIEASLEDEITAGRGLPTSLAELSARGTATRLQGTRDPQTGVEYGYRALDSARVELCARFAFEDTVGSLGPYALGVAAPPGFWRHPAGRKCFTVDFLAKGVTPRRRMPPAPVPAGD